MSEYRVRDEGNPRKYWIQVPNLVDDTIMSVHAFRLYIHLKRVAGDNGMCWQSTTTLADSCNVSTGTITKAKQELVDLGLISITLEKNPKGGKDFHHIAIIDIWAKNAKEYHASSLDEVASSGDELTSSPHEIKKNTVNNNQEKKEEEGANIFLLYEEYFGLLTKQISDELMELEKDYAYYWIKEAFEISKKNDAKSLNYAKAVLRRMKDNGFKKQGKKKTIDMSAFDQVKKEMEEGTWTPAK